MDTRLAVISVIGAFILGGISTNPIVEAANGGWQAAFDLLQEQIDNLQIDVNEAKENYFATESIVVPAGENRRLTVNCGDDIPFSGFAKFEVSSLTSGEPIAIENLESPISFGQSTIQAHSSFTSIEADDYLMKISMPCATFP